MAHMIASRASLGADVIFEQFVVTGCCAVVAALLGD